MIATYIVATLLAAAVLAVCARPASRGAVRQHLLAGELACEPSSQAPWLELVCGDDMKVTLTRHGFYTPLRAVSLAVSVNGFDIDIRERAVVGNSDADTARFILDFLASERYHITYRRDGEHIACAFSFHVRPGMTKAPAAD